MAGYSDSDDHSVTNLAVIAEAARSGPGPQRR